AADRRGGDVAQVPVVLQRRVACEMPRDAEILRQITHQLATPAVTGGKAQQPGVTRSFADDSKQRLDEGGLPRAIAAEQAKDLAPLDTQCHALQGLLPFAPQPALDISLAKFV